MADSYLEDELVARGWSAPYLGQVATSGMVPDNKNAGAQQMMSRTWHWARDTIAGFQLVYGNFYMSSGAETAPGANAATIQADVEFSTGVFTGVTFGGKATGSIPAGAMLASDYIAAPGGLTFGTRFGVGSFYANPDGIIYCASPNFGNRMTFGTTTPNRIGSNAAIAAQAGAGYGPLAIIAYTRRPSVALLGDSRVVGLGDTPDATLHRGYLARGVGPSQAYINLGVGADRVGWFNASHANRAQLIGYCSHVLCQYGINDIYGGGRTAAQVHADLQTLYGSAALAGKPVWQATLEPIGATGSYASDAGQTATGSNGVRVTFNDGLRGGVAGIQGVIDVAAVLESGAKSGVWTNAAGSALTSDGSHANLRGNLKVQSAGIVPMAFTR